MCRLVIRVNRTNPNRDASFIIEIMNDKNVTNKELLLKIIDKVDGLSSHVEDELRKRPTRFELFGYVGLVTTVVYVLMI